MDIEKIFVGLVFVVGALSVAFLAGFIGALCLALIKRYKGN